MTVHRVGAKARWAVRAEAAIDSVLMQRYAWAPFALVLVYFTAVQVHYEQLRLGDWDLLLLSGWATLIAGLALAVGVPGRLYETLERLVDRAVLTVPGGNLTTVHDELDVRARRWAIRAGSIVAVAILAAFVVAFPRDRLLHSVLVPFEMVGGFIAGFHLGRLASYGRLGAVLRDTGCRIEPRPGHIDEAAGLKPIGDFFFVQAMLASLPAAFLAVWWLAIPLYGTRYAYWRQPYLALLALAIAFEILAFLAPMLTFHREMVASKRRYLREADELSIKISELAGSTDAQDQLALSTARYRALEDMPTWPIDTRTRRRFRINNLALLLPLIGSAFGNSELGKQVSDFLRNMTQ